MSDELGGAKAAALVRERVLKIEAFRKIRPPTKTHSILTQLSIPGHVLNQALDEREADSTQ